MLGLSASLSKGAAVMRSFVKDNLKLYLDFKASNHNTLKFPCEGSTYFDGDNDYINIGDDTSLDITSAITLSCWIKPMEIDAYSLIAGRDDGTNRSYILELYTDEKFYWTCDGLTDASVVSTTTVSAGTWYHVACVYDGANMILYVNGVAEDTDASTGSIDNDDASFTIGAREAGMDRFFKGYLANMGLWSRALSAEEINSVMRKKYNQLKSIEKTSLVSWWALDSASNTNSAVDSQTETLGSELTTNGGFDADSDWTKTSVTISGGKAVFSSGGAIALYQGIGSSLTGLYKITFEVTDYTSGTLDVYGGGQDSYGDTELLTVNAVGSYTAYIILVGSFNGNIIFGGGSFTGSIDNVSVKEVTSGNTGIISGATTTTSVYGGNAPVLPRSVDVAREGEAEAIVDGSASFTASSSNYILSGSNINLDGGKSRTFSAWIRPDDNPSSGNIYDVLSYGAFSTSNYFEYGIFNDSGTVKAWANLYGSDFSVAQTFTAGEWYHYAVVYTAINTTTGTLKLYVNGILLGTSGTLGGSNSINTTNDQLDIGRRSGGSGYFNGDIAQLGAWAGALTQAQVQAHMESTSYATIPASVKSTLVDSEKVASLTNWADGIEVFSSSDNTMTASNTSGTSYIRSNELGASTGKIYKVSISRDSIVGTIQVFMANHTGTIDSGHASFPSSTATLTSNSSDVYYVTFADVAYDYLWFSFSGGTSTITNATISVKEVTNDLVGYWGLDAEIGTHHKYSVADSTGGELGSELFTGWVNNSLVSEGHYAGWHTFSTSGQTVTAEATLEDDPPAAFNKVFNTNQFAITAGTTYKIVMTVGTNTNTMMRGLQSNLNSEGTSKISTLIWIGLPTGEVEIYVVCITSGDVYFSIRQLSGAASVSISAISIKPVTGNYGSLK